MAKKYPWIKLRTDFFDSDLMDWIHEQENGTELIYIYLRLCMMAVNKEDGRIIRELGTIEMPYDATKLASVIKSTPEAIKQAMNVFQKVGILKIEEDGAITIPHAEEMVGIDNASRDAAKKRAYREKKKNKCVGAEATCPPHNGDMSEDTVGTCPPHNGDMSEDIVGTKQPLEKEIRERDKSEKEEKKEEKKNNFDVFHSIDSLSCCQPLKDALKDWARMRRQIKAPLNDRALSLGLTELKKLATDEETMVEIVNQTIFNSWKGFFPLRHNAGPRSAPNVGNRREQMKQAVDQGGWG